MVTKLRFKAIGQSLLDLKLKFEFQTFQNLRLSTSIDHEQKFAKSLSDCLYQWSLTAKM